MAAVVAAPKPASTPGHEATPLAGEQPPPPILSHAPLPQYFFLPQHPTTQRRHKNNQRSLRGIVIGPYHSLSNDGSGGGGDTSVDAGHGPPPDDAGDTLCGVTLVRVALTLGGCQIGLQYTWTILLSSKIECVLTHNK
jgi:hypothetical protein